MKSVIVRMQEHKPNASNAEKSIVKFLLAHPEEAAGYSIHQLAEKTFSSASTIIRLCRKTGFEGYKELQRSLIYELAIRSDNNVWQNEQINRKDTLEELVNKVIYKNITSLDDTRKLVDLENVEKCVELMEKADKICLFGIGSSLLVARDMYLKLLRVNKNCSINDDWHGQFLQAKNMTKNDMALIISYSGMTEESIACAREAKQNGAPIVVVSRFEDSPLVKLADYNLAVAATELMHRSGAMSSRISQLAVIDILYTAYIQRNYEVCIKQFEKTHIDKKGGTN
jgi:DNA-binding MurR/RpiR family transcriptional regulator